MGPFWRSAPLALHLPAHGRGQALAPALRQLLRQPPGSWDLPELPGFGGPLEPEGTVAEAQRRAAALLGAQRCWFGVNGASGLLQAALLALCPPGTRVLLPRNLHRSLLHGCVLGDIEPLLYDLPCDPLTGLWRPPEPQRLELVLAAAAALPGAPVAALVLVDPTYQGLVADLPALVDLAHRAGLPVLVDQAHGGGEALAAGADLVVLSVQKSGTGLAQSAALLAQGERVAPEAIERALLWLQTSSPSALLLASTAAALEHAASDAGARQRRRAETRAARLSRRLEALGLPLVANGDPLRLVLATAPLGINGLEADAWLLRRGVIAELPEPGSLTFCLGLNPPRALERRLPRRLQELRRSLGREPLAPFTPPPLPLLAAPELPIGVAWRSPAEAVPLERAAGRVAAAPICPYPPGIPLLVPGERIDPARAQWLLGQRHLWPGQIADTVSVVVGS
ncbi:MULTISPECIES: aminotransferase class I/II-fold pyridoxal phosphate-dependent enzyme [unclassified Cyanobium]|uniref:aminotransferase class I/II-fold pyridoxal phosphate-dependent enzyme n=1 Tax=unclassified Cyanobium TaxID=2627006 RepID=UPI0020CF9F2E|nr:MULTISPECIES: aminotransferase class I/II-fold pyridoxal phosphate-dependent enzyme [unclassified Cyanobium]MCP9860533.1 aminotransferase class I/II-fold pyridoxal phosphate-dependent enzyme [Cyanobium sp. Cruz-8H5]MCP9867616.1 aminotransferase class I/II-fold pyridoxal phosphate-dependent enzyme [Cyanobium sp. Cruz-8D1]